MSNISRFQTLKIQFEFDRSGNFLIYVSKFISDLVDEYQQYQEATVYEDDDEEEEDYEYSND